MSNLPAIKKYVESNEVQSRMKSVLDNNAPAFLSSLITAVSNNQALQNCKPESIMSAAFIAAALKLPIDPNLGFSAIIPYKDSAQFQIMVKGFIQLAIRSGVYENIHVADVYQDELKFYNPITGDIEFTSIETWKDRDSGTKEPCGYYACFKLVTGFRKSIYMSRKEVENHAKKYSQSFRKGLGVWKDDFSAMARKTVIKLLLSKYGILSTELQEAVIKDQSSEDEYIDNKPEVVAEATVNNPLESIFGGK